MRKVLFLLVGLSLSSAFAFEGNSLNIENCKNATDKEICVGMELDKKLNRILRKLEFGGGGGDPGVKLLSISYYDESNCTDLWAQDYIPEYLTSSTLSTAKQTCRDISETLASLTDSNSQVESVKIGGTCLSTDFSRKDKEKSYNDCLSRVGN